jgi:hypothetical protein
MTRCIIPVFCLVPILGCGERRSAPDIERGRQAVIAALDSWKANSPPDTLKSLPDSVDFTEELRATHQLIEYAIEKVDASDPEVIRYIVTLKLTDRKGNASTREVVYAVALKTPVIVSRDPYF